MGERNRNTKYEHRSPETNTRLRGADGENSVGYPGAPGFWNQQRGRRRRREGRDLAEGRAGAPFSWGMIAATDLVVNRTLLLIRYPFERFAKSLRCGELQRRRGERQQKSQSKNRGADQAIRGESEE